MTSYLTLLAVGLLPVGVSVIIFCLSKTKIFSNLSYITKQIIIGIIFGVLAIAGTEYGIPIEGAVLNARDAAPICAGLIFGAPAGIIAGVIGGVERWLAVYWGVGSFTRVACSVSTIIAGIYAAIVKKYMFDDSRPSALHSLFVGLVGEVIHMLMVFITNLDESARAFKVVQICTGPMVSTVAISVFLAVLVINTIDTKGKNLNTKKDYYLLSQLFQKRLMLIVVLSFFLTNTFTYLVQNGVSNKNTENVMRLNIQDAIEDIDLAVDQSLMDMTRLIANKIESLENISNEDLVSIANNFEVSEINVVNKENIIVNSNIEEYVNFDMNSNEQSAKFDILNKGNSEYIQELRKNAYDNEDLKKYAGKTLKTGGYVQVAFDEEHFLKGLSQEVAQVALNRHVGETGHLMVVDSNYDIVSGENILIDLNIDDLISGAEFNDFVEYKMYQVDLNGTSTYIMIGYAQGFIVVAYLPVIEAVQSRDLTMYITSFIEIIIFEALFMAIYFLIKYLVVNNIIKVDDSLSRITQGNLDTVVDVKATEEFASLSTGINKTVDALKQFIEEAKSRIDAELSYAAEIQRSALPSDFPAFPSRDEFDIYALMDPAKEVGGDFYDFYLINKHTLVITVADVSGKGIPASLFMMRAKTALKSYTDGGLAVNDVLTNANFNLYEGNDAGMFVTAWIGFLDLETGELNYACAGHNPPCVKRKDGEFEYLKTKPVGFVLGGIEGVTYKAQSTTLNEGDQIYLYTDGVTEATNINNELFGEGRLKESLDRHSELDAKELCIAVKKDVDDFVGEAPQFDDITMLSLKFKKLYKKSI